MPAVTQRDSLVRFAASPLSNLGQGRRANPRAPVSHGSASAAAKCEARFLPTGAQGYGTPHNAPLRVLPVELFATPGPIASSERLFLRFAHGFFGRFARWCVEREWHVSIPPRILKAPEGSDEPMGLTPANARFNRQQKSSTYTARRHRGWFAKNLHVYLKRSLLFSITYTLNPYLQPL